MIGSNERTITIRNIETIAEIREVERLQREVWGVSDLEVVPLSQLVAAMESGGVLIGAFDGRRLAGFVYGFLGLEGDVTVHHSHLLAVRPEYRGCDLGFRLKCEQRLRVIEQGIDVMTWTFDPLQSLNARFNFGKLGVIADRYVPDLYGTEAESFLHQNGTDRFWVTWQLTSARVERRLAGEEPAGTDAELPVLVAACEMGSPQLANANTALASERFAIEIPRDIGAIERADAKVARNWRTVTRDAFTAAIDAGFVVEDFVVGTGEGFQTGSYILGRDKGQFDFQMETKLK